MPNESSVSSDRSFSPQADQRDVVARRIEARDHPAEQPLDAVHPRPLPAEVIADLQHVQLALRRAHAGPPVALADDPRRDADRDRPVGHRTRGPPRRRRRWRGRRWSRRRGSWRRPRARRPAPIRHAVGPSAPARAPAATDRRSRGRRRSRSSRPRSACRGPTGTRLAENISQLKPMLAPSPRLDVAVLARQDGVAADEHAVADRDAAVGRLPWHRAGSCRR